MHITAHPDWVLKHKKKGILIMKRDDKYYLYRVSSHWNKEKKRAQLKTEEYLGRITPDGLIEPKAKQIAKRYDQILVKEYGSSFLLNHISPDIVDELKKRFPEWKEVFAFACMRLMHWSPIKNVEFHHISSFLSEMLDEADVSPDALGPTLRRIGTDRKAMVDFMRSLIKDDRYMAVDLTHVLSMSEGIISSTLGHNSREEYLPQIQLLFLFSLAREMPAYFRIMPGSINSVASLKLSMGDSGAGNIVLVSDTGFYSKLNVRALESMGVFYIIPLKRSLRLIDYSGDGEKHFMFQDHPIFYRKYQSNGHTMYTFRNDFLKAEEEKGFLARSGSPARFRALRDRMGTISVITNLKVSGEIVYGMLKSRTDIEQSYDTFKNTIYVDRTYMRDDQQVQGWIFVNFIALLMHYRIYALMRSKDLIRKYSPEDVLEHLGRVFMLKVEGGHGRYLRYRRNQGLLSRGWIYLLCKRAGVRT